MRRAYPGCQPIKSSMRSFVIVLLVRIGLAADVSSCGAATGPDRRAVHSRHESAPKKSQPAAWPPGLPLFSQHILQYPIVQCEFAYEPLQLSVLPLQHPQTFRHGDLHAPNWRRHRYKVCSAIFGLTTSVADVPYTFSVVGKAKNLLYRKAFTLYTSSS